MFKSHTKYLKSKNNFIARIKPTKFPFENEIFGVGEITTVKKTDFGPAHVLRTNTKPPLAGPYGMCVPAVLLACPFRLTRLSCG